MNSLSAHEKDTGSSIEEVGRFYGKDASTYDEKRFMSPQGRYIDRVHKEIVLEMIAPQTSMKILEVGAGTGRFSITLAEKGARMVTSDISQDMLDIIRKKAIEARVADRIELLRSDAHNLDFQDNTFDACLCVNVLDHIKDDRRVLAEFSRVLKPGGVLVINVPLVFSLYLPIALYVNLSRKSVQGPVYSRWYSYGQISRALTSAGLKISDTRSSIILPRRPIPRPLLELLKKADSLLSSSVVRNASGNLFVRASKV